MLPMHDKRIWHSNGMPTCNYLFTYSVAEFLVTCSCCTSTGLTLPLDEQVVTLLGGRGQAQGGASLLTTQVLREHNGNSESYHGTHNMQLLQKAKND
jgi:hypothetical protein